MSIQQGDHVTLHFELKTLDGRVVESTYHRGKPAELVIGDGHLPESFEHYLIGLDLGQKEQWQLEPESAFGIVSDERIAYFTVDQFPSDSMVSVGTVMGFSQPNGNEIPGIIKSIDGDSVTVDFNHPLAGENILFSVEIVDCCDSQRR
ncbi:MAG: FKBP-type 16 kDa peptidyl-prolyl cis-trans isomerase [Candidatus Celerinatantimonas neptuna]|nr:MAG: FKBP-type 16 kDa peptidyl-prolyl cis-trans isomerase [Candidatus Celerinatantimonas neptuna]